MSILAKEDLSINGVGTSAGGQFRRVSLNGAGRVSGDVICQAFECNGKGTVNGDLKAENVQISGHGKINGSLESNKAVQIDGHGTIEKSASINKMIISGFATIGGPVKGSELVINGKTTIHGDCEVDCFKSEGAFTIDGLINADDIHIHAYGHCQAREIGGQDIKIKFRVRGLQKFLKRFFTFRVETDLIEGNNIELEGTKAKVVRGENIFIGADCEIDLIEYSGSLKNNKGSLVRDIIKI